MENLEVVIKWWQFVIAVFGFIVTVIGFGISVGKLYQRVKNHDEILKKVIDADTIVKRHLFNRETSESIYVPRAACISLQTVLRETLAKIEASSEKTGKEIVDIKISMSGIQRAIEEREKWEARNHKPEQ